MAKFKKDDTITRVYKYRAYPTKEAVRNSIEWLRLCCDLWNGAVLHRFDTYYRMGWGRLRYCDDARTVEKKQKNGGIKREVVRTWTYPERPQFPAKNPRKPPKPVHGRITLFEQGNAITTIRDDLPEFKTIPSKTLHNVLKRVDDAYTLFFSNIKAGRFREAGLPTRKRYREYRSFTLVCAPGDRFWSLSPRYRKDERGELIATGDTTLRVNGLGALRLRTRKNYELEGVVKQITIKQEITGKWSVFFVCRLDDDPARILPKTGKSVGIDVGVMVFAMDSDAHRTALPSFFERAERRLALLSRRCSRKVEHRKKDAIRGSKRMRKAYDALRIHHERVAQQREDFHNKLAWYYVKNYDTIYIENLDILSILRKTVQEKKPPLVRKRLLDAGIGLFLQQLKSRGAIAGRKVIEVPAEYTTMTCSRCGNVQHVLLSQRIYDCDECGLRIHRKLNAALNIAGKKSEWPEPDKKVETFADLIEQMRAQTYRESRKKGEAA